MRTVDNQLMTTKYYISHGYDAYHTNMYHEKIYGKINCRLIGTVL